MKGGKQTMFKEQISALNNKVKDINEEIAFYENKLKERKAEVAVVKRAIKSLENAQATLNGEDVDGQADISE
jgi:peptidoglycan hydrolase CwlO-like protein